MIVGLATDYGGTEAYVVSLVKLLRDTAQIQAVVANGILHQKLQTAGIRSTKLDTSNGVGKLRQLYQAARLLIAASRAGEVNTLLVNGYSEIILAPLARVLGHRAVATRHLGFSIEACAWPAMLRRRLARLLYQIVAPSASCLVAVSEAVASDLRANCYLPLKQLTVIPNWVNAEGIANQVREQRDGATVRLLYVGRLVSFKGLGTLLDAVRTLVERSPSAAQIHLDVVGTGPDEALFREHAGQLPVTFHGMSDDVPSFYQQADVFVNPSLGPEGLPLVTLEAMASGLPCVLSDLPVHLEVAGGGASVIFARGSASGLSEKLGALIDDAAQRQATAQRSLDRIRERFTPDKARTAYRKALAL